MTTEKLIQRTKTEIDSAKIMIKILTHAKIAWEHSNDPTKDFRIASIERKIVSLHDIILKKNNLLYSLEKETTQNGK